MRMRMHLRGHWHWIVLLALLAGAWLFHQRRQEWRAEQAARQAEHCLDYYCAEDRPPITNSGGRVTFKANGQWFAVSRDYGGANGTLRFYWPGGQPANAVGPAPPGTSLVEIFLKSRPAPPPYHGYRLLEWAQRQRLVASREPVGPGLERVVLGPGRGPDGYTIDPHPYYVATRLTGPDGLPPVASCVDGPSAGGATRLSWRPGIWAGVQWQGALCADFPALYLEIQHVLRLVQRL